MIRSILPVALALALVAPSFGQSNYAKKQKIDCDNKGACKIQLGKAGLVKLPALVAFKTAHQ
jgi:hypothetical protein